MDPERSIWLLGVVVCIVLAAMSSAADAALTMISRHRLHAMLADKRPRAQAAARLLDDPARFKAATLTLNITAAVVSAALLLAFMQPWTIWWHPVVAILVLLLALLVFGEACPKILASLYPERTALLLARPVQALAYLLLPFTGLVNLLMRPFVSRTNAAVSHGSAMVSEEELKLLVNVGAEEGLFQKDEREMIEGILIFGDTLVREVMVPRVDIQALDEGATVAAAIDLAVASGHSRIPVFRETIDNVAGILYVRDLLPLLRVGNLDHPIGDVTRPVYYVPETMKGDDLLRSLKGRKVHIAVVVDEYGGTAGIVTIEDLIEEIVGEIQDEYDVEEPYIKELAPNSWLVDARVSLDDLNNEIGIELQTEEADSLGGLVYEQLGTIPRVGDEFESGNVVVRVHSVQGVRPEKLEIMVREPEPTTVDMGEEVQREPG